MPKVCFCGISGSGMSALAQVLNARGYEVFGSDRSFDNGQDLAYKTALESVGIKVFKQDGSAVSEKTDCLYVSSAVEESIKDVKKAMELGVKIQKRSDLLAEIFNAVPLNIAVGGTSGKTTLTAMIGFVLDKLGKNPTVINGGLLKNYTHQKGIPNVILGGNELCVVEADESDGSIEKYNPYVAVVNNITIDHKPIEELQELFSDFILRAKYGVVNLDCKNSEVLLKLKANLKTFSIKNSKADVFLTDIKPLKNGVSYKLGGQVFTLNLIGAFNVLNAAAAMAALMCLDILPQDVAKALESFTGTKRRLDVIGTRKGVTVIDDFAHNPDKVLASMSALRDYEGRLLVMFQPHGFAPMRMMGREIMESFVKTMQKDDRLFVPEIFYAGGSVVKDISSKDLVAHAVKSGLQAQFFENRDEVKKHILKVVEPGDRIVIMGARDNSLPAFCEQILSEI